MLAHTFRGSTWRSAIGLEDSRAVFARYKAIRRAERDALLPSSAGDPPRATPSWRPNLLLTRGS